MICPLTLSEAQRMRALHAIAVWLVAWVSMQIFGLVVPFDGIAGFAKSVILNAAPKARS